MIELHGAYFTVELDNLCVYGANGVGTTISRSVAADLAALLQRFADTGEIEMQKTEQHFAPPADGGYRLFNND